MTEFRPDRPEPHPLCQQLRQLRRAAGVTLRQMEDDYGVSAVLMGSYERGDRVPPLPKIDALFSRFGYRVAAIPVDETSVRIPSDMAAELRVIADQLDKMMKEHREQETAGLASPTDTHPAKA